MGGCIQLFNVEWLEAFTSPTVELIATSCPNVDGRGKTPPPGPGEALAHQPGLRG